MVCFFLKNLYHFHIVNQLTYFLSDTYFLKKHKNHRTPKNFKDNRKVMEKKKKKKNKSEDEDEKDEENNKNKNNNNSNNDDSKPTNNNNNNNDNNYSNNNSKPTNHSLELGTKVDVWFSDKLKYFSGKILAIEDQPETYTILFHSKQNTGITLDPKSRTSHRILKSDNEDRWNLVDQD